MWTLHFSSATDESLPFRVIWQKKPSNRRIKGLSAKNPKPREGWLLSESSLTTPVHLHPWLTWWKRREERVRTGSSSFILVSGKRLKNPTVHYRPKTFKSSIFCGSQRHREKQNLGLTVAHESLVLRRTGCFSAAKMLCVLKTSIHHFSSHFWVHVPSVTELFPTWSISSCLWTTLSFLAKAFGAGAREKITSWRSYLSYCIIVNGKHL